jgi:hypothetical protein
VPNVIVEFGMAEERRVNEGQNLERQKFDLRQSLSHYVDMLERHCFNHPAQLNKKIVSV